MGDFHYKEMYWENLVFHGDTEPWRAKFLECVEENLYQQVTEHTRNTGADTPSILDLIFMYNNKDIRNIKYYDTPLGKSDHVF